MSRMSLVGAALLIASTGLAIGGAPAPVPMQAPGAPGEGLKDVLDTARGTGEHNTFIKAVLACGLDGTLNDRGPYTVMAPTDAAFKEMGEEWVDELLKPENKGKLSNTIKFHVIPATVTAEELKKDNLSPATLNGYAFEVKVRDGKTLVGTSRRKSAAIVKPNIQCTNGLIHSIDAVMRPPAQR